MRVAHPALTAHRNARISTHAEWLVWIEARNRDTRSIEAIGLWTGTGERTFLADGVHRPFIGTSVLDRPRLHDEAGIRMRRTELGLLGVSDAVQAAFLVYDTYNAPVIIWRAEFDADKNLIATPERAWRGRIEAAPITTGIMGEGYDIRLTLVSDAWRLTTIPPLTKSAAAQERRGDHGRRYSNVHDATVQWGETQQQPKRKKFLGIF